MATLGTAAAVGCTVAPEENDDDDGGDSSGSTSGDSTTGSGTTEEYLCCLNGSFFECPDESSFDDCGINLDPGECARDESRDDECAAL